MRSTKAVVLRWLDWNLVLEGEWECRIEEDWLKKPNHVLTMFSGRLLCQWNGKCKSKWDHGNLVAYARKKKLANERQPNFFTLLVTLTTFFFPKFFSNLLSSFFFYQHFLSQHANIYHIVTSRLLLIILIETYGSFLLPFIWYQYVWYCSFLLSFCFVLVDLLTRVNAS
jgi:hypothetical protein